MIVASKRFAAIGTLSRSRGQPFLHAVIAKSVAAGFDDGVFEVPFTDVAVCDGL